MAFENNPTLLRQFSYSYIEDQSPYMDNELELSWTDSYGDWIARGSSLHIGMTKQRIIALGWNSCSTPGGVTPRDTRHRVIY